MADAVHLDVVGMAVVAPLVVDGEHVGLFVGKNRGEALGDRRVAETALAAEILGVERLEFLGYHDSGMMGETSNERADCFWSADVEEAAERLATILREEEADVLTVYDAHGVYGHPDHIQVHRVGVRAGELAGTPVVYEATMNREYIQRLLTENPDGVPEGVERPDPGEFDEFGTPEDLITTKFDVRAFTDRKRAAMAAHESQIAESHFFLAMPTDMFREAFGYEWFIRRGAPSGTREAGLFEGMPVR